MSAKALFSAIVFCAALAACAGRPFTAGAGPVRCTGQNCDVQVFVTCSSGGSCAISVDIDTLQVPRGNSPNITWQSMNAGYTFPGNGIVFSSGGAEFENCHVEANGRRYMCHDKHMTSGMHKYTINLTGSPAVQPLDPFIQNE